MIDQYPFPLPRALAPHDVHIQIPLTSYIGLILRSTTVATTSYLIVLLKVTCSTTVATTSYLQEYYEGTLHASSCHSSISLPSKVLQLAVATVVLCFMRPA